MKNLVLFLVLMAFPLATWADSPPAATPTAAATAAAPAGTETPVKAAKHTWVHQVFGPAMAPLWLCSVTLLGIIFNRFRATRRSIIVDKEMVKEVTALVGELKLTEAMQRAAKSPTRIGRAWAKGLKEFILGGVPLQQALTESSVVALKPLRAHLWLVTTIGVVAPMFGLIGTVVGMIITFSTLAETGGVDKAKLAVGLSFALYKTAGGLIVAIPSILFGRFFTSRVGAYVEEVESDILTVSYAHSHGLARAKGDLPEDMTRFKRDNSSASLVNV